MSITDTKARDLRHPFSVNIIGLDNFTKALSDPTFRKAAGNTAYFVLVGMPLTLVVALAAAVALDKGITRFRAVFRLGFYMPVITSIVAVAVVWRFLLQDPGGLINTALGWFGITGPNWLGDPNWSMPALIMMAAWRNFGTAMIIFLAGLQAVPAEPARGRRHRRRGRVEPVPLRHDAAAAADPALRHGHDGHRLPPVLRGALRHDQGWAAEQHDLAVDVHLPAVRLRQLRPRVGDEPTSSSSSSRSSRPCSSACSERGPDMSVDTAPRTRRPLGRAWSDRARAAAGGCTCC